MPKIKIIVIFATICNTNINLLLKLLILFDIIFLDYLGEEIMINLFLGRTIEQFLAEPLVVVGLALIVIGVSLAFLARRITRAVRENNNISSKDKLFVTLKILAMLFVIAGFVCVGVEVVLYIATRQPA